METCIAISLVAYHRGVASVYQTGEIRAIVESGSGLVPPEETTQMTA